MACMTGLDFDGDSDRDADPGLLPLQDQRRRKEVWDGGKTTGIWGRESASGVQERSPGRRPGGRSPQKLKNF